MTLEEHKKDLEIKTNLINKLIASGIEEREAKKEISILFEDIKDIKQIEDFVEERSKTRKPFQYLTGKAYFMDFTVKVDERVLVPRPETEILVEETVKRLKHPKVNILDIGTGSGIIPIAISKLIPNAKITAIDIKKEILELAEENTKSCKVNESIKFKQCDIFSKCFEGLLSVNKFDVIISNPPYITNNNQQSTEKINEVDFEPDLAKFGSVENKDGLAYYEKIIEVSINHRPALIAFEIDPPLVNGLIRLMERHKINSYEFIKDYSGLERCLFIVL